MTPISPFKTIVSNDTYIVNGGKIINYYNPLNFRDVRKDRDAESLPQINDYLSSDYIYAIDPTFYKIEVFLFASFLPPVNWVAGDFFSPKIENCWIVRKETLLDNSVNIYGEITNNNSAHIRFDNVNGNEFGYACNLGLISIIRNNAGIYTVDQVISDNFVLSRLFDSVSFVVNNSDESISQEDLYSSNLELTSIFLPYYKRGYIETTNSRGIGSSTALSANDTPPINNLFAENIES